MRQKQRLVALLCVMAISSFWGRALAAEMEYTDPARQARWEQAQQKRAEEAEHRRIHVGNRIEGWLKNLQPHRQPHLDDQAAGTTVSNIQLRSEMK